MRREKRVKTMEIVALLLAPHVALAYRAFDGYEPEAVVNCGFAEGYELVADLDEVAPIGSAPGRSDVLVKRMFREGSLQEGHGPSVALETGVLLRDGDGGTTLEVTAGLSWAFNT